MGHTARRTEPCQGALSDEVDQSLRPKKVARLELLPEEALYLLEKGSLQCWKQEDDDNNQTDGRYELLDGKDIGSAALGTPISLQQAYAEMIGRDDLSLERYQVRPSSHLLFEGLRVYLFRQTYAYLKRLGFVITRAEAPPFAPSYPLPPPISPAPPASRLLRIIDSILSLFSTVFYHIPVLNANCWAPLALKTLRWRWSPFNYCAVSLLREVILLNLILISDTLSESSGRACRTLYGSQRIPHASH